MDNCGKGFSLDFLLHHKAISYETGSFFVLKPVLQTDSVLAIAMYDHSGKIPGTLT